MFCTVPSSLCAIMLQPLTTNDRWCVVTFYYTKVIQTFWETAAVISSWRFYLEGASVVTKTITTFLVHVAKHQVRSRVHLSVVRFHPILYQITLKHTSTGLPEKVLGYSTFSFCLGVGGTDCFTALSHCFYCIGFTFEELSCCLFSCLFVKWNY